MLSENPFFIIFSIVVLSLLFALYLDLLTEVRELRNLISKHIESTLRMSNVLKELAENQLNLCLKLKEMYNK